VAQGNPEQPVHLIQLRTQRLPLEHSDLLSQGEDLKCSVMPTAEEDSDSGQGSKDEFDHEPYVVPWVTPSTEAGCLTAATRGLKDFTGC
jgi:hypothetical protein